MDVLLLKSTEFFYLTESLFCCSNDEEPCDRDSRAFGFSQRERRLDRHSTRRLGADTSPQSQSRTRSVRTTYRQDLISGAQQEQENSEPESPCSEDRSEHSSNRRFLRLHASSRSPSVHSLDNKNGLKSTTKSRRRSHSGGSPSQPTTPASCSDCDDVDSQVRARMRKKTSVKQSSVLSTKKKVSRSISEMGASF